jgi:peptide/nickel transport system substrate-binding protein
VNKAKKWLSLILAGAVLAGALSGCGNSGSASSTAPSSGGASSGAAQPVSGGILRFGTDSEPTGFDPHTNSEEASLRIINQLYEPLVGSKSDMTIYGRLAESWEIPNDTTYVFHLRHGVKFHSGREMTADDVVYSFDRILGKTSAGNIGALGSKSSYYGDVTGVTAADPYTVEFTLKKPNAAFLSSLTSNYGAIVDQDVVTKNKDLSRADGGTGPFTLGEWLPDNYVKLSKFKGYWDTDRVKLDGITYFLIGDEAARLAALRTGQVDIANLSATNVTEAKKESSLKVISYQTNTYIAIGCNLSTAALQNKNVRQAMDYAIDRQAIINVVFGGQAVPSSMMPPAMGHWSLDVSGIDLYKTNVDKAKKLMEDAGYNSSHHLTLKVAAGLMDSIRQTAVVLQQQLSEIYIDLKITNLESAAYVDAWGKMSTPKSGFDLMVVSDGAGTDPNRAVSFFFGTGSSANVFGFSNKQVDDLCAKGIATTDEKKREEYYNEAQKICIDDCTKISLVSPMNYFVTSTKVGGFQPSAADSSNFRDTFLSK